MTLDHAKELFLINFLDSEKAQIKNVTKYLDQLRVRNGFKDKRTRTFFKKYTNTLLN